MTLSTYDLPVIYLCLKLNTGKEYMTGYKLQHLTFIHIIRVREVFMTMSFIHNGCTYNRKGRVRKGVLTILTFVTLKRLKESTYDSRMMFIYL